MPRIVVENVTKPIRGRRVLDGVSLTLEGGRIYGLTGPNGSGKTMLLRALCGLILPDRGSVTVDGRRLHRDIPFPPGCGVLIGHMELLPGFTAYENLKLLAKIKKTADDAMIRAALHDLGLDPDSRARVRTLSLGQKQRLAIAQALFEDPAILLLDEPADALDWDGTALIRDLLLRERERGKLIVMASHSREDIECLADTVIGAEEGRFAVSRL